MIESSISSGGLVPPGANAPRRTGLRRCLTAPLALLGAAAVLLVAPALAGADSSSTLTVVGTSDVSDSGLIPNVVQPDFHKDFPGITFKYIGTATGTAISDAESGSTGASALVVHAASLENQFVAKGYSYKNQYGYATFRNDFVLAGAKADPAGVAANAAHNVAQAFADVAKAGINGDKATFVSRGGTPGTTVEEHAIWALVRSSGLNPTGLLLCAVNSANGGGDTPIAPGNGVTASGQPCPNGGALPTGAELPAWYKATGLTQGPNVEAANSCNFPSGANTCYVFTDRGTYDYLASGTDGGITIPSLQVVTRGPQAASTPGGAYALTNYFHAYIINPSKPGESVNLTAAKDLITLLTTQSFQNQLHTYLAKQDAAGPPFVADASPAISITKGFPRTYRAGGKITVTGTVTNNEIGYPALAHRPVTIDEVVGQTVLPVAGGKTNPTGRYSISFVPPVTGSYEVATPQLTQIENATLSPPFGDTLSPGASAASKVTVHSAVTSFRVKPEGDKAVLLGTVAPGTGHVRASVTVLARRNGKGRFNNVATDRLSSTDSNFATAVSRAPGRWQFEVKYQDPRQVVGATSRKVTAAFGPRPASTVTLESVKVKKGALTVTVGVTPPVAGTVELLGLRTAGSSARFARLAKTTAKKGKSTLTLRAQLRRGSRWVLQLEYVPPGRPASNSGLKTINVT
jgi:ABC-type tungstate transport system permease subunit